MKLKSVLVLSLILLSAVLLLASCGKQQAAPAAANTIVVMSWYTEAQFRPFLDAFEKETGIKVDLQFVPPVQQYTDKFMVLVASKQVPDVFFIAAENKQDVFEHDLAEDLSPMPIFKRIPANVSGRYGKDGKIYGYAPECWIQGVFYNKDIFANAGITKDPSTWDEFVEICRKIKALGIEPMVQSSEDVGTVADSLYNSMVISTVLDNDQRINRGQTTFEATYTQPYVTWYNDLVKSGLYSQISLGLNGDQAFSMFTTGQSAMYVGGPWNINDIKSKNPDMNFDIFAIPDNQGNIVSPGALNVGLSISSSSTKKDQAFKFLDFMSRDENILKWQRDVTGMILIVQGLDYDVGSVFNKYKYLAEEGKFYLTQMEYDNAAAITKEKVVAFQDVMTGADKVENVPKRLDAKMEELKQ
jgi:raffinose/stachyose/melibiose transport system substrate-binding protein